MLTTAQTQLVAVSTVDGPICLDCAYAVASNDTGLLIDTTAELRVWLTRHMQNYWPIIAYRLDEWYNDEGQGVWCADCGKEMAAPYCAKCGDEMTEDNWANPNVQVDGDDRPLCNDCWGDKAQNIVQDAFEEEDRR